MSYAYSYTETTSFTITHARGMAAKVATDLKRMHRFYGKPSDPNIDAYEQEVVELLKGGYLRQVWYGFRRNGKWITPVLRYTARDLLGGSASDDAPGRVLPGADISGASFYSYLTYSAAWDELSQSERDAVRARLPISRSGAPEPAANGYWESDRTYSRGGRALDRASLRSY